MNLFGWKFVFVTLIEPFRLETGVIREYFPQTKYRNAAQIPLNPDGEDPFCQFRIPNDFPLAGVYLISINDRVVYVGECEDFSRRFNTGYGTIQPRNCFKGGQSTNCKVNHLILNAAKNGGKISLWFCKTNQHKTVEVSLITKLHPKWNTQKFSSGNNARTQKILKFPSVSTQRLGLAETGEVSSTRPTRFYIYENWQAGPHKAIIHSGSCGHCNDGRGRAGGYDPSHARWHGPFDSFDEAKEVRARIPGVVNRKECRCVF